MIKPTKLRGFATRFSTALAYAAQRHATQLRKRTNIPYLSHLLAVSSLVLEHGGDEEEAIAALLHDVVEDQGGKPTLEEVRRKFGKRVAGIVEGCTDADVMPKPPWKPRKLAYIAHLRKASRSVRLVAAADKLHNARCMLADYRAHGERLWKRFNAPKKELLWYHRAVTAALKEKSAGDKQLAPLVEELERVVGKLERVARNRPVIGALVLWCVGATIGV